MINQTTDCNSDQKEQNSNNRTNEQLWLYTGQYIKYTLVSCDELKYGQISTVDNDLLQFQVKPLLQSNTLSHYQSEVRAFETLTKLQFEQITKDTLVKLSLLDKYIKYTLFNKRATRYGQVTCVDNRNKDIFIAQSLHTGKALKVPWKKVRTLKIMTNAEASDIVSTNDAEEVNAEVKEEVEEEVKHIQSTNDTEEVKEEVTEEVNEETPSPVRTASSLSTLTTSSRSTVTTAQTKRRLRKKKKIKLTNNGRKCQIRNVCNSYLRDNRNNKHKRNQLWYFTIASSSLSAVKVLTKEEITSAKNERCAQTATIQHKHYPHYEVCETHQYYFMGTVFTNQYKQLSFRYPLRNRPKVEYNTVFFDQNGHPRKFAYLLVTTKQQCESVQSEVYIKQWISEKEAADVGCFVIEKRNFEAQSQALAKVIRANRLKVVCFVYETVFVYANKNTEILVEENFYISQYHFLNNVLSKLSRTRKHHPIFLLISCNGFELEHTGLDVYSSCHRYISVIRSISPAQSIVDTWRNLAGEMGMLHDIFAFKTQEPWALLVYVVQQCANHNILTFIFPYMLTQPQFQQFVNKKKEWQHILSHVSKLFGQFLKKNHQFNKYQFIQYCIDTIKSVTNPNFDKCFARNFIEKSHKCISAFERDNKNGALDYFKTLTLSKLTTLQQESFVEAQAQHYPLSSADYHKEFEILYRVNEWLYMSQVGTYLALTGKISEQYHPLLLSIVKVRSHFYFESYKSVFQLDLINPVPFYMQYNYSTYVPVQLFPSEPNTESKKWTWQSNKPSDTVYGVVNSCEILQIKGKKKRKFYQTKGQKKPKIESLPNQKRQKY
ncbi:MAG: hypothetical protein GY928_08700 [Colwellia sp.]|nr:hypothetical protein [Colwellia sp.]